MGISVIKVCKKAQNAGLNGGTSITLNTFFWLCIREGGGVGVGGGGGVSPGKSVVQSS